jgi:hypothetical protein
MKKLILTTAIALVMTTGAHAGFRGSSSFRSSSGFRSYSRPSYSSPRPSYSSRSSTTIINNHHYDSGGFGFGHSSGFLSGMMWGSILSDHSTPAPAAPSVIVVPQAGAAPAPVQEVAPAPVTQVAPAPAPQEIRQQPEDGETSYWTWFMVIGTVIAGAIVWKARRG